MSFTAKVFPSKGKSLVFDLLLAALLVILSLSTGATQAQAAAPAWSQSGFNISGSWAGIQSTSIQMLNGTPYVAFSEHDFNRDRNGKVGVMKYENSSWSFVKSSGSASNYVTEDATAEVVMAIDGNVLYVAFYDTTTGHIVAKQYDTADPNAVWEIIGSGNEIPAGGNLSICAGGGKVYVTFVNTAANGCVYLYDGTTWSGGIISPNSSNSFLPIVAVNGTPYMAYYNNDSCVLAKNTVGVWNTWTFAGSFTGDPIDMCADSGMIYVLGKNRIVTKFDTNNNNSSSAVGAIISSGQTDYATISFDNGALYVGFMNLSDKRIYVKRFNGSYWEPVGSAIPYEIAYFGSICANNNKIYCAFGAGALDPILALTVESIDLTAYLRSVSVSASPSAGGTVSGGGAYMEGNSATVTATANSGYLFVNWTENGTPVSTNASYTFTLGTAGRNLVANFERIPHSVTVSANPADGGTVEGEGTYYEGDPVTVTATANNGYAFVNWTENGTQVSTEASYTFTLGTADRTLVANFAPTHTVSVSVSPSAGGSAGGGGTFAEGTSVTVTATANSGYAFVNWTENGTQVSTDASYTFNLGTADTSLVANFIPITHTVIVSANPHAGGTVSGGGTYNEGDPVTVTATANYGFVFVNWTENGTEVSTDASYTFTLGTSDRVLVANFGEDWDHIFEDIKQPTMKLYINTKRKTFQFVAPNKVFPVKTAPKMLVISKTITICFKDRDLTINALATGGGVDSCIVTVKDVKTGKIYMLVDSIDTRRSFYR